MITSPPCNSFQLLTRKCGTKTRLCLCIFWLLRIWSAEIYVWRTPRWGASNLKLCNDYRLVLRCWYATFSPLLASLFGDDSWELLPHGVRQIFPPNLSFLPIARPVPLLQSRLTTTTLPTTLAFPPMIASTVMDPVRRVVLAITIRYSRTECLPEMTSRTVSLLLLFHFWSSVLRWNWYQHID